MVRVGLVGCGTIGSQVALALQREFPRAARITALYDVDRSKAEILQRQLASRPPIVFLSTLVRKSHLIIEAASVEAVPHVLREALRSHRDVFLMSVGALLHDRTWQARARRAGIKVYVPSGALIGLDGIKAMAVGRITRVTLTTRKPPRALIGSPYVRRKRLALERLTRPSVIFQGTPREVVKAFPQNTNVAAALALASGVSDARARVRVVADPSLHVNVHEVEVDSDCGHLSCRVESRPSRNPKTSELAVRSAMATLRRIFDPIAIGT